MSDKPKKLSKKALLKAKYANLEAQGNSEQVEKKAEEPSNSKTDDQTSTSSNKNESPKNDESPNTDSPSKGSPSKESNKDDSDNQEEGPEFAAEQSSDESDSSFEEEEDEGFVEEDFEELSEPEVEVGSRRRRPKVDYAQVLAEMEAEEKNKKVKLG